MAVEAPYLLEAGLANLFSRGPDRKSFQLCKPYGLCCIYLILPGEGESSQDQYANELGWLCAKKTRFTKTGSRPDVAGGCGCTREIIPSLWYELQPLSPVWLFGFPYRGFTEQNFLKSYFNIVEFIC